MIEQSMRLHTFWDDQTPCVRNSARQECLRSISAADELVVDEDLVLWVHTAKIIESGVHITKEGGVSAIDVVHDAIQDGNHFPRWSNRADAAIGGINAGDRRSDLAIRRHDGPIENAVDSGPDGENSGLSASQKRIDVRWERTWSQQIVCT